jgi:glucose/arabinose dehydrogenase
MSLRFTPLRGQKLHTALMLALMLALLAGPVAARQGDGPAQAVDWRDEWALAAGFTIERETGGFTLPSSITFVPEPGPAPGDPLYFVTELRGRVKVVTNDRTVHTFADNSYIFVPEEELPSGRGQGGQGGLCLDPASGYVFVTFMYQDAGGTMRNGLLRYATRPGSFALQPAETLDLTAIFAAYPSGLAHHIGACQVVGDTLFIGIGEAWQPHLAQDPQQMVGKIFRMTLDGQPLPDNPFYEDGDPTKAVNYVWATGLRNPYAMRAVDGRLFVADNGIGVDRFLEIERGENYYWDGRDASIAMRARYLWVPSIGPAGMTFIPPGYGPLGGALSEQFLIAISGSASRGKAPGIYRLAYDFGAGAVRDVPDYFLRYRGHGEQIVVDVEHGPDGLYFVPLMPDAAGESFIYRITPDAADSYPHKVTQTDDPVQLIDEKGCVGCHRIGGEGGFGGTAGPPLDRASIIASARQRVASPAYLESLAQLDALEEEPWASTRDARAELLAAEGEELARVFAVNRIMEPRFDTRGSQMPNLGLSRQEAELIADHLLREPRGGDGIVGYVMTRLRTRLFWFGVAAGFAGAVAVGLFGWMIVRRRGRRTRGNEQ